MEGLPLSFDPKIFLFSIANFIILFFVLKKFFFGPIYNILKERKDKIKESLENIEHIKKERDLVNTEKEHILSEAKKESQEIIREAENMKKEILAKNREEVEKIIQQSREEIKKEKEELRKEMNVLLVDLVSTAVDKALPGLGKHEAKNKAVEAAVLESLEEISEK